MDGGACREAHVYMWLSFSRMYDGWPLKRSRQEERGDHDVSIRRSTRLRELAGSSPGVDVRRLVRVCTSIVVIGIYSRSYFACRWLQQARARSRKVSESGLTIDYAYDTNVENVGSFSRKFSGGTEDGVKRSGFLHEYVKKRRNVKLFFWTGALLSAELRPFRESP